MSPEQIVSNTSLKSSVRYAAARSLIETETHCRKERRKMKFFVLEQLHGLHKKGHLGKPDYVVFNDGTKAVF